MFAIVESRGRQYKVSPGDVVALDFFDASSGDHYVFDKVVMLVDDEEKVILDRDNLDKVKVSGVVTGDKKGEKLVVFKYKKRKGYHRKRGHRQRYTLVKIEEMESPFAMTAKKDTMEPEAEPETQVPEGKPEVEVPEVELNSGEPGAKQKAPEPGLEPDSGEPADEQEADAATDIESEDEESKGEN